MPKGDADAIVRQTRGFLRLLNDPKSDRGRRQLYFALIADGFERLDALLSAGDDLPSMWERRKPVVNKPTAEGGEAPEGANDHLLSPGRPGKEGACK